MSAVVIDIDDEEPPQKKAKASEPSCVVDLTSDDDAASRAPAEHDPPPASPPPPAAPAVPRWKRQRGVKRILGEVRDLQRQIASGALPQLSELALVEGDACDRAQFRVSNFDDALPGGRQLNADLAALAARRGSGGQDYIQMEIRFPADYPTQPPFLRCISPRFVWYTGHVTAGGSICTEALTLSGTPRSWSAELTVEGVLASVLLNLVDCESTVVRTASGPGGRSGPLRVDLDGRFHPNVMAPYSEAEALAAFARMREHHRRNGW